MAIDFVTANGDAAWADVHKEGGVARLVVSIANNGDFDILQDPDAARTLGTELVNAAEGVA
jgi:hypothetical protein